MCLIEIKIFEKHLLLFAHTSRSVNYGFTNIKHMKSSFPKRDKCQM